MNGQTRPYVVHQDEVKPPKVHSGIAVIEVSDPLVLTEIENDPSLRAFLGDRLSDRCVAVQPQAIPEVVERLRALGQMPNVME